MKFQQCQFLKQNHNFAPKNVLILENRILKEAVTGQHER